MDDYSFDNKPIDLMKNSFVGDMENYNGANYNNNFQNFKVLFDVPYFFRRYQIEIQNGDNFIEQLSKIN